MVVHGAIILNQFNHYPVPAVKRCAFAATLRERMQSVRHSKLYAPVAKPARAGGRAVNRNPMKDRAAGGRSKPMTATSTTMVRAVWAGYFGAGKKDEAEEEAAEGADAVAKVGGFWFGRGVPGRPLVRVGSMSCCMRGACHGILQLSPCRTAASAALSRSSCADRPAPASPATQHIYHRGRRWRSRT